VAACAAAVPGVDGVGVCARDDLVPTSSRARTVAPPTRSMLRNGRKTFISMLVAATGGGGHRRASCSRPMRVRMRAKGAGATCADSKVSHAHAIAHYRAANRLSIVGSVASKKNIANAAEAEQEFRPIGIYLRRSPTGPPRNGQRLPSSFMASDIGFQERPLRRSPGNHRGRAFVSGTRP
jgi:hypothetical protein